MDKFKVDNYGCKSGATPHPRSGSLIPISDRFFLKHLIWGRYSCGLMDAPDRLVNVIKVACSNHL